MLLSRGKINAIGGVGEVINEYIGEVERDLPRSLRERENRDGTGELRFVDMRLERDGQVIDSPTSGEDCDIVLSYETQRDRPFRRVNFGITVYSLATTPRCSTSPRRPPAPCFATSLPVVRLGAGSTAAPCRPASTS